MSRDPIGADGQESAYLYCGGDPVGATDGTGLIATLGDTGRADEYDIVVAAITHAKTRAARSRWTERAKAAAKRVAARQAAQDAARRKAAAESTRGTPGFWSTQCQKGSRYSLLPSKPDGIDWALMSAGATLDAMTWGVEASIVAFHAPAGPAGIALGLQKAKAASAPLRIAALALDAAGFLYTTGKWVNHKATIGDVAISVLGFAPAGVASSPASVAGMPPGSSAALGAHTAFTIVDGLMHGDFYARPEMREWGPQ